MLTNIHSTALFGETKTSFLFPSVKIQVKTRHQSLAPPSAICWHRELPLLVDTSEFALCAEPAYTCRVSYKFLPTVMHITQCLLDTGDGLSLFNKTLISQTWKHRIQQWSSPKLGTANKQPLHVKDKIILHARFGFLYVSVWSVVVSGLAVKMLFGTLIIDRFIRDTVSLIRA